ncbi:MAG TPA: cobyrinic acid a,c-diamide synthase [Gammaproteobacteria bacterium]|nr:cobyrinic acid a,c-diamide synthase [Gammaproteobacteria bacterium]
MLPPGLLISAPSSGAGKTTVMLGLLRALTRQGVQVQPFKTGPDYIDPAFHHAAAERASYNLDSWAMQPALLHALVDRAQGADLALAEGAMGLFDAVAHAGETATGASADIAALTGWPVVLVLDVSAQAQSAAATALGFATLQSDVTLAGVVLNQVASPRHEALVRNGLAQVDIPVLGALPRHKAITLPERHLGLVQASEHPHLETLLNTLGDIVAEHVDLAALLAAAGQTSQKPTLAETSRPPGQRIALAKDAAFSFVYPHLLDGWRAAGAELLPFSPLANQGPDDRADVCWLPGGYPELHAGQLAAAETFRQRLRAFATTRPVHGECGGYMAMGAGLVDKSGTRHRMAGLLGLETSYEHPKLHLGYRLATLRAALPGQEPGTRLRGHEFHYCSITAQPDAPLAKVVDANGDTVTETGSHRGHASGSFFHLIGEAHA